MLLLTTLNNSGPKHEPREGADVNGTGLREDVTHPNALCVTCYIALDPARGYVELFKAVQQCRVIHDIKTATDF